MAEQSGNPLAQQVAYVNFAHVIDEKQANFLMQLCADIVSRDQTRIIYLMLSSPGGSIDYGITLYNFLRALPCIVFTHNIGSVESIANIVFLAGEKRFATPFSRFLLHGVFWNPPLGVLIPSAQISECHARLRDDAERIRDILLNRTTLTKAQIDSFHLSGESHGPDFAKEVGIISDIADLRIQKGCATLTCNPA